MDTIGIVGVGRLAGFLVEGLRRGGCTAPILLSPRNAIRAADLAQRFDGQVMPDNQAVVDGAGIGSCMVANKVPGVRAATCWDVSSARNSREHNHANVLALGAGLIGESLALEVVQTWLETPWGGDRHARRVAKITDVEQSYVHSEVGARR